MFNANNYGYNPYGRYITQQPMEQLNNQQGAQQMFVQPTFNKPMLNGKQVESIDVVKAMDIPLDGSINYFPIADGSAIVTKRLQMDGTSKITIYKATEDDITETVPSMNNNELTKIFDEIRNDIKELKQTLNKEDDKNE